MFGKAHALATGMEEATSDIIIWSDDDVDRDDDGKWLERLVEHARRDGAATEVPVFIGDGFWPLFEPVFMLTVTYDVLSGSHVWGGGVAFDRTTIDEEQFLRELRRTVGDDILLSEYLADPWIDRDHIRQVKVPGDPQSIYHRVVRWIKPGYVYQPRSFLAGIAVFLVLSRCYCLPGRWYPDHDVCWTVAVPSSRNSTCVCPALVSLVRAPAGPPGTGCGGTDVSMGESEVQMAETVRRDSILVSNTGLSGGHVSPKYESQLYELGHHELH